MILYNVTTKVDWSIHEDWLTWMLEVHMPEIQATGLFYDSRIFRLLEVDDQEGPTYAVQYYAKSMENCHHYITTYSAVQRTKTMQKWGDKMIAFRSVMQAVN